MSSVEARTGREKQRYEDKLRLVAGCIPYKFEKSMERSNCNFENNLLVLMISSPNRDDLVFPKGGWEDDETITEAACREALEEAGVRGILSKTHLGYWVFRSKSRQNSCSLEGGCKGYMYSLQVTEELDSWPEQTNHDRKWLTIEEAFRLCRYDWMRDALKMFLAALSEERENERREKLVELPIRLAISEAVADQISSAAAGCYSKHSGVKHQHLESVSTKCVVQG
ncbi:nudix hydrolase 13, mitochondrial [Ziziphus jujuba]|uniref:Nudix hydrolase 13, mitochondrial n=1 Tax=Ziziphus jujuba TaxID=326968 RepID=A0ABM3I928_ZIZJJ|nr:nudix hydrolase 13, mitochondrial [Ziziphus jujuba]